MPQNTIAASGCSRPVVMKISASASTVSASGNSQYQSNASGATMPTKSPPSAPPSDTIR